MEWIEQIKTHLSEADRIAKENGVPNLFYNEMFLELIAAQALGHQWKPHTQGGDAYETETSPTEYKFINLRNKTAGSFQFHWLSENKMKKLQSYDNMFFGVRDGVEIQEIWKLSSDKILTMIEEKATGTKKINGHKSFSLDKIKELGAEQVYIKP